MISHIVRCAAILGIAAALAAGCAKTPSGGVTTDIREMAVRIEFNGPINDNYYYYVPIDTTSGGLGPVPVFPGLTVGEGWVTGSATHYVQYHQRQYMLYKITSLQPFASEPIGSPVRFTLPDAGANSLAFTIDLNAVIDFSAPDAPDSVDLNVITTDQPLATIRLLDGLGRTGNDFVNVDILTDRTISNADSLTPETSGDVLDQNVNIQPSNAQTNPLDITGWSITLDI